jgi:hypothetical protein
MKMKQLELEHGRRKKEMHNGAMARALKILLASLDEILPHLAYVNMSAAVDFSSFTVYSLASWEVR